MPTTHRRCLFILVAACLALPGIAAADTPNLPDLGEASEAVLSHPAELKVGAQAMQELKASGAYLDDPEVNAYLERIGQRLVAADPSIDIPFHFFAVGSNEINAFALPGGYIGVNSGLILATRSESELTSVLAHEISHVTQHHAARMMAGQSNAGVNTLAAVAAAVVAARIGGGQAAGGVLTTAMAAQAQGEINYTRANEEEADRLGFARLVAAGFDAQAMAAFFTRLQQATRISETDTAPFLRSHPMTEQRIAEAADRAAILPYRQVADSADFDYVRALLQSYDGTPQEAVARLADELKTGRTGNAAATRYGLAAALLRAKDYGRAQAEIAALDRKGPPLAMVDALAGQILSQSGQLDAALHRYQAALQRHPEHLQLVYDYPRALLLARRPAEAAAFAEGQLLGRRGDAALHQIAAEADAALGRQAKSHYHQGEYYAANGDIAAAVEQLDLAVKIADGDDRDAVVAEARWRELRQQQQAAGRPGEGRGAGMR